jgi:hypothetical protein
MKKLLHAIASTAAAAIFLAANVHAQSVVEVYKNAS